MGVTDIPRALRDFVLDWCSILPLEGQELIDGAANEIDALKANERVLALQRDRACSLLDEARAEVARLRDAMARDIESIANTKVEVARLRDALTCEKCSGTGWILRAGRSDPHMYKSDRCECRAALGEGT